MNNGLFSISRRFHGDFLAILFWISTLYAAVSRIFAAKKGNELSNDIRIKAGTIGVKNKIRLLKFDWNQNLQ